MARSFGVPLGYVGGGTFTSGTDEIDASIFNLHEDGEATDVSIRMASNQTGVNFRLAIYSVSGGVPDALLGYTSGFSGNVTAGQVVTLALTSPVALTAGEYAIAAHAGSGTVPVFDAEVTSVAGNNVWWKGSTTYGSSPPSTFPGSPSTSTSKYLSIGVTYTPDSEAAVFGTEPQSDGADTYQMSWNEIAGLIDSLGGAGGTFQDFFVRLRDPTDTSTKFKIGIYSVAGGAPDALIDATAEHTGTVPRPFTTHKLSLSSPLVLGADDYALVIHWEGLNSSDFLNPTATLTGTIYTATGNPYSGGLPDPYGGSTTTGSRTLDVWGEYTPAPPPPPSDARPVIICVT